MSVNHGPDGVPHRVGILVVDTVSALYAFQALSAALHGRGGAARGRHIDVNLIQAAAALQAPKIAEFALEGGAAEPLNVPAGSYRTADGWIAVALIRDDQFRRMVTAMELAELAEDPRFQSFGLRAQNAEALLAVLREAFLEHDTETWLERLQAVDLLCNRINDYGEWLADPHVEATGAAQVVEQPGIGAVPVPAVPGMPPIAPDDGRQRAPAIGEHGREILRDLGHAESEIEAFVESGALHLAGADGGEQAA